MDLEEMEKEWKMEGHWTCNGKGYHLLNLAGYRHLPV